MEQGREALDPVVGLLGLLDTVRSTEASLTSAEQEVIRLAIAGPTNPEIGKRLFMSRSTVKTHLAHVSPNSASLSGSLAAPRWQSLVWRTSVSDRRGGVG